MSDESIKGVGAVSKCFEPGARSRTRDIRASESPTVTAGTTTCVPATIGTCGNVAVRGWRAVGPANDTKALTLLGLLGLGVLATKRRRR
jgi:MYXO-CTERM domain-containing protein